LILVDTSVWVDHLRSGDPGLVALLERAAVVMHPFVRGEVACGSLRDRKSLLELLRDLPEAVMATDDEAMQFIERHRLYGKGIGYVDVHLLASVALTGGVTIWTRDRKLRQTAAALGHAYLEGAREK
jgi:predicted nucleic acid-binding protein